MRLFSPRLTIPFCGGVNLQTWPNRRRNIVSCVLTSSSVTVPWRLMAFLAVGRDELAFVGKWVPFSSIYNVTTAFLVLSLLLFTIEHILWRQSVCEVLVAMCFFHLREFKVVARQCLSNGLILDYEQDLNQFCLGCWQVNYWALILWNRTLKGSPPSEPWDNRKDDTFPMSPSSLSLSIFK